MFDNPRTVAALDEFFFSYAIPLNFIDDEKLKNFLESFESSRKLANWYHERRVEIVCVEVLQ